MTTEAIDPTQNPTNVDGKYVSLPPTDPETGEPWPEFVNQNLKPTEDQEATSFQRKGEV